MDFVDYDSERDRLVSYLVHAGFLKTGSIIAAFQQVHRHLFVMPSYKRFAYDDSALPVWHGSTISQPSTAATMLELLQPGPGERVLEIGTGSGWQACLLASCVGPSGSVVSMEIDPDLVSIARENVAKIGPKNLRLVQGDGSVGCPDAAPYDKIIYAAATKEIPRQVLVQLNVHGWVVAPVGSMEMQTLTVVEKAAVNKLEERRYGLYNFAPLRGQLGF